MSPMLFHAGIPLSLGLVLAVPAAAAGGGGGENHLKEFAYELGNLILLVGVIVYFARKPIQNFFGDRREKIRSDIGEATQILADAEARLSQWQERMSELDAEIEKIRATERRRAEREREKILEEAQQSAERIQREAGTAVEREVRRAQEELRREAAELALEMAETLLRERMGDADQSRLVEEFIARVESANPVDTPERSGR